MNNINTSGLTDLGLTATNSGGGCCGGGSCACGSAEDSAETTTAATTPATAALVTTDLAVTGMTCGHCVSSVTEELSELAGVESVTVQLNVGGASTVTITSQSRLDPNALQVAVTEAGYALADS